VSLVLWNTPSFFVNAPKATSALSRVSVARGFVPSFFDTCAAVASGPTAVKTSRSTAVRRIRLSSNRPIISLRSENDWAHMAIDEVPMRKTKKPSMAMARESMAPPSTTILVGFSILGLSDSKYTPNRFCRSWSRWTGGERVTLMILCGFMLISKSGSEEQRPAVIDRRYSHGSCICRARGCIQASSLFRDNRWPHTPQ
jgi:hypothetical protein